MYRVLTLGGGVFCLILSAFHIFMDRWAAVVVFSTESSSAITFTVNSATHKHTGELRTLAKIQQGMVLLPTPIINTTTYITTSIFIINTATYITISIFIIITANYITSSIFIIITATYITSSIFIIITANYITISIFIIITATYITTTIFIIITATYITTSIIIIITATSPPPASSLSSQLHHHHHLHHHHSYLHHHQHLHHHHSYLTTPSPISRNLPGIFCPTTKLAVLLQSTCSSRGFMGSGWMDTRILGPDRTVRFIVALAWNSYTPLRKQAKAVYMEYSQEVQSKTKSIKEHKNNVIFRFSNQIYFIVHSYTCMHTKNIFSWTHVQKASGLHST